MSEWIPVTQALPTEEGSYLVTVDVVPMHGVRSLSLAYFDGEQFGQYSHVIAWTETPKAYDGGANSENNV